MSSVISESAIETATRSVETMKDCAAIMTEISKRYTAWENQEGDGKLWLDLHTQFEAAAHIYNSCDKSSWTTEEGDSLFKEARSATQEMQTSRDVQLGDDKD